MNRYRDIRRSARSSLIAVACAVLAGPACTPETTNTPPVTPAEDAGCTAGTSGCACLAANRCLQPDPAAPLICRDGRCQAYACPAGGPGCPCGVGRSCEGGLACSNYGVCQTADCRPGSVGCPCGPERSCDDPTSACSAGSLCVPVQCPAGQEGCACRSGSSCGYSRSGEPLSCGAEGICASSRCEAGAPGCVCLNGYWCSGASACRDGFCIAPGCEEGTENCACGTGCATGLDCFAGSVCVSTNGATGSSCDDEHPCQFGNRCTEGRCAPCAPGEQGCACAAGQACNEPLECDGTTCVATAGWANQLSAAFECFTPCESDLDQPGDFRACSGGLMRGCLPGLECVSPGQCLPPGATPPSCQVDTECPAHHACLFNQCRSNCVSSDDCRANAVCVETVCRRACVVGTNQCPGGYTCVTDDATTGTGICMPEVSTPPGQDPGDQQNAQPYLHQPAFLNFDSGFRTGSIHIVNRDSAATHFTVRKLRHRAYDGSGASTERTLELRGDANPVDQGACVPGTPGCRCSGNEEACVELRSGLALSCQSSVDGNGRTCRLPACTTGPGCICTGADCRLLCEDCPLDWLALEVRRGDGTLLASGTAAALDFDLAAGDEADIVVTEDRPTVAPSWDGDLELDNGTLRKTVRLRYGVAPKGSWTGEIYYFGDFSLSTSGLSAWQSSHADADAALIHNAFVRAWAEFRQHPTEFEKFRALLTSTREESWRSPGMREVCPDGSICFPYFNADGFRIYTSDPASDPVPSGVVEYPFAITLEPEQAGSARYRGRINSDRALQYGGFPAVTLELDQASGCSVEGPVGCLLFVDAFGADIVVGGRHAASTCSDRYEPKQIPWMVPGFTTGATFDPETGTYSRSECREKNLPLNTGGAADDAMAALNTNLAGANPMADGRERRRHLELVDGALINSDTLFVIFRERIESITDSDPAHDLEAYGYFLLRRDAELPVADPAANPPYLPYQGNPAPVPSSPPPAQVAPGCSATLLATIRDRVVPDPTGDPEALTQILLGDYTSANPTVLPVDATAGLAVHYLCEETGLFDRGSVLVEGDEDLLACPAGSRVLFFTLDAAFRSQAQLDEHACRAVPTDPVNGCKAVLLNWERLGFANLDPLWRCEQDLAYCSDDRHELRKAKQFYQSTQSGGVAFLPIRNAVGDAFRYRTRFQTRQGTNLGFVPSICVGTGDSVPYCYDPKGIAELQDRADCLLDTFVNHYAELRTPETKARLSNYLGEHLAYAGVFDPVLDITVFHSGFEKLSAELLIMLGDEAYTRALSSRFDLAGLAVGSFVGSKLEPGGINLSGVAGAEMSSLYQAAQYYELALGRFFRLLPLLEKAIADSTLPPIVGQATVVEYVGRLIRASTQKAKATNEISKRYQNFNRPDLARLVIQRGYTGAYLESVVLSNLMQRMGDPDKRPDEIEQIRSSIRLAQVSYRVAMSEMREQFDAIREEINFFGFPADYIPFPASESEAARDNAFEVMLNRAWQRLQMAQQAEDLALQNARSFDTDAASFQSELIRVDNNYEAQLSDLCGTFEAGGSVYPSIKKFAYLSEAAELEGDPCGRMGTGQIHEAVGALQLELNDIQRINQQVANLNERRSIEEWRINRICGTTNSFRDTYLTIQDQKATIELEMDILSGASAQLDHTLQAAATFAQLTKCSVGPGGSDCPLAGVAATVFGTISVVNEIAQAALHEETVRNGITLRALQKQEGTISFEMQCNDNATTTPDGGTLEGSGQLQIESKARVLEMMLEKHVLHVEILRAQLEVQQAMSRIQQARQQARRLQSEMEEMEQMAINVEAARNNPNVRIYKNDAIINADATFFSALREVYKATRVYEYYTSQSYGRFDQLFLVRMISRGDYNLQNYLVELEDSFRMYEDQYGLPDLRVTRLSLMNDLLQVPRLTVGGEPMTQLERSRLFTEMLSDAARLDDNGYIVIPFATQLSELSPLTRNHKIRFVQAAMLGPSTQDLTARVYLRMRGTAMVSPVSGDDAIYYTFPDRTAVINAFFGTNPNTGVFDPAIYRNSRLADRPYLNTQWELVLNLADEPANRQIVVEDITDVLLYLYYTDFTIY